MSKYSKYPSYKDSGVEWLGEIPEGWEDYRIDWVNTIIRGNTGFKKDELLNTGEYVALQYGKTYRVDEINGTFKYYVNSEFYKPSQVVNYGDTIFISTSETVKDLGHSCFYSRSDLGLIGGEQILLKPNAKVLFDKYFYFYSKVFSNELRRYATGLKVFRFNIDDLKNIFISLPPLQEQKAIATYLDRATQKIDTLIAKQSSLIALLKEKRQALISHAVTKGLDSDAKMKESGVAWLGEIPEGWEVGLLSSLFINNKVKNTGMKNSNLLSLSYGKIIRKSIDTNTGLLPANFESYQILKRGYIVLRLTDLQNDKKSLRVGFVREEGIITSAYVGLAKKSDSIGNEKYFYYYLHTFDIHKGFYGMGAGVRQGLNFDELKKLKFLLPPTQEQDKIVEYIERQTQKIDTLITKATEAITLLKEKRTALISAVVTGKVDVRGEVA